MYVTVAQARIDEADYAVELGASVDLLKPVLCNEHQFKQ